MGACSIRCLLRGLAACLLVLLAFTAGCVKTGTQRGIAVETLRPVSVHEGSLCGEIAVVKARLDLAPSVESELTEGERRQIMAMARAKFEDVGFLRNTDRISTSLEQQHHDLIIMVNALHVDPDMYHAGMVQRTAHVAVAAHVEKNLVGCFTARPYEKNELRQVVAESASSLPHPKQLQMQALDKALDRVIRQFAPKKVHTFRTINAKLGVTGKIATLLESGNCQLAADVANSELSAGNVTPALQYHAGVAAECLASRTPKQSQKRTYLTNAKQLYSRVVLDNPKNAEATAALKDVERQLFYLNIVLQHEDSAKEHQEQGSQINVY